MCIQGSFEIKYNKGDTEKINYGETVLLPAVLKNISLTPKGKCKLLEIYIN